MILAVVLLVLGSAALVVVVARRTLGLAFTLSFCALLGIVGLLLAGRARSYWQASDDPHDLREVAYEQSGACRKCHPDQYDSWHASFHRTMTQEPSSESVIGDFDDVTIEFMGHPCRLYRRDDEFFMELVDWNWEQDLVKRGIDPASVEDPPRRPYRVDRLVGSHELQVYLHRMPDGTYVTLPLEWNQRDRRWVTSAGNYLQPPREIPSLFAHYTTWNETCIFCHNTRPNPGVQGGPQRYDSQVAELGIACEACHGPGEEHVRINRDPLRRQIQRLRGTQDPSIVQPAALTQQASLDVCGRCHGKASARDSIRADAWVHGDPWIPGQVPLSDLYRDPLERADGVYDERVSGYFWPDGSPRPTAMEYQGVILSPCAEHGPMDCLSCHSMHASDPTDQLRFADDPSTPELEDNQACLQCHADLSPTQHSHHLASSEGNRCVECHMPLMTFGLMKSVRSHRIVDPSATTTARYEVPNGCNQCHVDRSLAWTAKWLAEWYEMPGGERSESISRTVDELLRGHALNRAIAVTAMGSAASWQAAPGSWRVPFLLGAMRDDYAAVRLRAYLALCNLPGFADAEYDYLAADGDHIASIEALRTRWLADWDGKVPEGVPLRADGSIEPSVLQDLIARRDHIELTILE